MLYVKIPSLSISDIWLERYRWSRSWLFLTNQKQVISRRRLGSCFLFILLEHLKIWHETGSIILRYLNCSILLTKMLFFGLAICFTETILVTIFFFWQNLFYFLLNASSRSALSLTVASTFSNKSENLCSQLV